MSPEGWDDPVCPRPEICASSLPSSKRSAVIPADVILPIFHSAHCIMQWQLLYYSNRSYSLGSLKHFWPWTSHHPEGVKAVFLFEGVSIPDRSKHISSSLPLYFWHQFSGLMVYLAECHSTSKPQQYHKCSSFSNLRAHAEDQCHLRDTGVINTGRSGQG